ncbi:MAG: hypothetical protein GXP55_00360 [Deltaproteobacteria bacterium]|nr:hypothetical protein [Deltaproteobacteria bacterium]
MPPSIRRLAPVALALFACSNSHTAADAGADGRVPLPDARAALDAAACSPSTQAVDLLFVVDNSGSMGEEQASLAEQIPAIVRALTTGVTPSGERFSPVTDLHLGVVDTDMGTGGFAVPTCADSDFGDDGLLRFVGDSSSPGCRSTYPPFLTFPGGGDALAADFACVARVGTDGCGFEQPLEAALKALTPESSGTIFHAGSGGHGDAENAGFLRDDSVLGLFLLTDEDDCSVADPSLFDFGSTSYPGDLNMRCHDYPEALHPVGRYASGFRQLRPNPARLVLGIVAGVPIDLVGDPAAPDFASILGDARMQERIDPTDPLRLVPSCDVPGRGLAFPPGRLVGVGRSLADMGAGVVVGSICQADLSAELGAFVRRVADARETPRCFTR